MAFEKIPLEEWKKLSPEEQSYHTLKFKQSVEKRQRWTIIITRIIAIIFIIGLFQMGYVQLESVRAYEEKLDKYGTLGFCALCGEYTLKRCECQYAKTYDFGNVPVETNKTKIAEELSEYNSQYCAPFESAQENGIKSFQNYSETLRRMFPNSSNSSE